MFTKFFIFLLIMVSALSKNTDGSSTGYVFAGISIIRFGQTLTKGKFAAGNTGRKKWNKLLKIYDG